MLRDLFKRLSGSRRSAENHISRGNALAQAGQPAESGREYERAIEMDPRNAEAYFLLGVAQRDQRQFANAIASYKRALALRPDYAQAHNNLGAILQLQGDLHAALASYRDAVDLNPDFRQPYVNLGRLAESLGDYKQAARSYRRALERGLDPEFFAHLLNAVTGAVSARAPAGYARAVFDDFAEYFDERLIHELHYKVPELLASGVKRRLGNAGLSVLDLGCGTGLCAMHLASACNLLTGVDVSSAMLAKARARDLYHELERCDLEDYLRTVRAQRYDAVLAADVLVYLGDLASVFGDVARALQSGGVFAFSIEHCAGDSDFVLQSNARYAHSTSYIRRLAAQAGFEEIEAVPHIIRGGSHGYLFLLTKQ